MIDSYVFFLNMVSHRLNLDEGDVNVIFVIRHGNFLKLNWDGKKVLLTLSVTSKCHINLCTIYIIVQHVDLHIVHTYA